MSADFCLCLYSVRTRFVRSEHATADMFKELMKNNARVDVDKAQAAGGGGEEDQEAGNDVSSSAKDLLMRLPGVNVHNYRNVSSRISSSYASLQNLYQAPGFGVHLDLFILTWTKFLLQGVSFSVGLLWLLCLSRLPECMRWKIRTSCWAIPYHPPHRLEITTK